MLANRFLSTCKINSVDFVRKILTSKIMKFSGIYISYILLLRCSFLVLVCIVRSRNIDLLIQLRFF